MPFDQAVILEYSVELFDLLQYWANDSQIDIDFVVLGNNNIEVFYNDPTIIFLLGRAYQNKKMQYATLNT